MNIILAAKLALLVLQIGLLVVQLVLFKQGNPAAILVGLINFLLLIPQLMLKA
jgi:hypothetical protein